MIRAAVLVLVLAVLQVNGRFINLDIFGSIRNGIEEALNLKPRPTAPVATHHTSTYFPYISSFQPWTPMEVSSTYDGAFPPVSTLPQDGVDGTTVGEEDGRALIDAPMINGSCPDGYRSANGRCRRIFGRRRRRR